MQTLSATIADLFALGLVMLLTAVIIDLNGAIWFCVRLWRIGPWPQFRRGPKRCAGIGCPQCNPARASGDTSERQ